MSRYHHSNHPGQIWIRPKELPCEKKDVRGNVKFPIIPSQVQRIFSSNDMSARGALISRNVALALMTLLIVDVLSQQRLPLRQQLNERSPMDQTMEIVLSMDDRQYLLARI
jgi:hypothetical protein